VVFRFVIFAIVVIKSFWHGRVGQRPGQLA
jgi:hypothetical protein